MREEFSGYEIVTNCQKRGDGRYSVSVVIERIIEGTNRKALFTDTGISLFLEVEAEKESINLGKNIIRGGRAGF